MAATEREVELRSDYIQLRSPEIAHRITDLLSEDQWVESNLLLDQGFKEDRVAGQVRVEPEVIILLLNPRSCLEKYRGNPEALRRCLEGKDPREADK